MNTVFIIYVIIEYVIYLMLFIITIDDAKFYTFNKEVLNIIDPDDIESLVQRASRIIFVSCIAFIFINKNGLYGYARCMHYVLKFIYLMYTVYLIGLYKDFKRVRANNNETEDN